MKTIQNLLKEIRDHDYEWVIGWYVDLPPENRATIDQYTDGALSNAVIAWLEWKKQWSVVLKKILDFTYTK